MTGSDILEIHRLESSLAAASRIAVVTHAKPDGDAMGSSTAMYHFIKQMNPSCDVRMTLSDRWPRHLDFLMDSVPAEDVFIHSENEAETNAAIKGSDLIICLDFNAFHRTDRLEGALVSSQAEKILIDHHLNPDRDSFDMVFSVVEISSASELLYDILMKTERIAGDASRLPEDAAVSLMTGMTTDTNNFANSTYPSTLVMASELLAAGVDRDRIISEIYNQHRETRLRLMGHSLKDLLTITDDGVAYIVLDSETLRRYDIQEGETEGFVNIPLSIASVRMSLLLKEEKDKVRVSIRSKKGTSANQCARRYFNGGGHENAAGGRLNIPSDIRDVSEAAAYIEKYTHIFLNDEE